MGESGWDFSKYVDPDVAPGTTSSAGHPPIPAPPGVNTRTDYAFPADGGSVPSGAPLEHGKPPVVWLLGGGVAAVAGGVLALLFGEAPPWAIIAWFVCGPVAIGLLANFTRLDTRQRARQIYSREVWVKPLYVACLMLCGIAVVISAFRIASWLGRL